MRDDRYRTVPSGRLSRLTSFGQLAGGIAGNVLAEGVRRLASGERPHISDLLLTPANVTCVTNQLSKLRGAAMKLGQMISMDAGDILPAELTAILARLRDSAHYMPTVQLNKVLIAEWGPDWRRKFKHFEATPIAAASIGQVHRATLRDGTVLAIKVQYPGVADSINADVDNVASLFRMAKLLPGTLDIAPLLAEAKKQLSEEADYVREANQMRRYKKLLANDPAFLVPTPYDPLCGKRVLAMDFISGQSIEKLETHPQKVRDEAMSALLDLVLRELFEFGYMQSDPNFANYRWQAESGKIVLLDFGAARPVLAQTVEAYRRLMQAGLNGDSDALRDTLLEAGFMSPLVLQHHRPALDNMIKLLVAHLGKPGLFHFADRSFVDEVRRQGETIVADRAVWHIPPADTLFVQRKVSGTALLAIKMNARLPLREMVTKRL
ncbi:ABC1 kinase family protein [Aquisediminimonas profunda]|uniref:ABC1 kinase family protein n=1 Tax=Aquisediminimonas profunda TaxID=1550733 RepID=UPI001C637887|nr:AarF/ABC1/UbiB kinase family protein [Aquisediminimonas profunda]